MKRVIKSLCIIGLALAMPAQTFAMCTWGFVPPFREYEPLNATEAFVSYEDGEQIVVMVPEFKGNATDFGIVYPTPSRPLVSEGPRDLFNELNDFTNPEVQVMFAAMEDTVATAPAIRKAGVSVIEVKDVGDYTSTVLHANSASELVNWLKARGYDYSDSDVTKMNYYVEQGGYYFVALRVNMDKVETDSKGFLTGKLNPIQFNFATTVPQLPMRSLTSNMPEMTFDLYTLADNPLYVPGVDTMYANVMDNSARWSLASMQQYDPTGKWLMRQEVTFDPSMIKEDLHLTTGVSSKNLEVSGAWNAKIIDPQNRPTSAGILTGDEGKVFYTSTRPVQTTAQGINLSRNLFTGVSGTDVQELQRWLNANGFTVSVTGAGSLGQESTYFGSRTRAAVIKMQNHYKAEVLSPVGLNYGTGYVGPSTREFLRNLDQKIINPLPINDPTINQPENCSIWYDGCNTCTLVGGDAWSCTERACFHQDTPKCLETSDSIGTPTGAEAFIGMTEIQARNFADKSNIRFRVVQREGMSLPVTADYQPGRVNATISNGVVTGYNLE